MTLVEQKALFKDDIDKLINFAVKQGTALILMESDELSFTIKILSEEGEILDEPEALAFLADYWESLSPRNRNGRSYKEPRCGLFERIKE